ncbi:MAG: hypothetical protein ABJN36_18680 [Cyclobacteriaceae bacterium]
MELRKWMNPIMLSCKKAAFLIDKKEHKRLSPIRKLQLKIHTFICEACHSYEKQSRTIGNAISHCFGDKYLEDRPLPTNVKDRIMNQIKKEERTS